MKHTKDFARYYIMYQDNLNESDRNKLLNYVDESSEEQVKHLLHTGYMSEDFSAPNTQWFWDIPGKGFEKFKGNFGPQFAAQKRNVQRMWQEKQTKLMGYENNLNHKIKAYNKSTTMSAKQKAKAIADLKRDFVETKKALDQVYDPRIKTRLAKLTKLKKDFLAQGKGVAKKIPDAIKVTKAKTITPMKTLPVPSDGGLATTAKKVAPTLIIAAAIATASYHLYKRYLSKAAKACSGRKGDDKTLCMDQYKKRATQARIRNMQTQMSKCNNTKEPTKCKAKVQSTIRHLQSKI